MSNAEVRIDKWLWAARFFKTRQLAIDAIDKGKVKLSGGERIKPSRNAKLGERLHIDNGADEWDVMPAQANCGCCFSPCWSPWRRVPPSAISALA